MGYGFTLQCKHCDYEQRVLLGAGFLTQSLAEKAYNDMKAGTYGAEFKEALEGTPYAAVHLMNELFVCPDCGELTVEPDVLLCAPTEGYVPECAMPALLGPELGDGEYTVLLTKTHTCAKCGAVMNKAENPRKVACPRCRGELTASGMIMWD